MVDFKFDALYRLVFIESLLNRVSIKVNRKFVLVGAAVCQPYIDSATTFSDIHKYPTLMLIYLSFLMYTGNNLDKGKLILMLQVRLLNILTLYPYHLRHIIPTLHFIF